MHVYQTFCTKSERTHIYFLTKLVTIFFPDLPAHLPARALWTPAVSTVTVTPPPPSVTWTLRNPNPNTCTTRPNLLARLPPEQAGWLRISGLKTLRTWSLVLLVQAKSLAWKHCHLVARIRWYKRVRPHQQDARLPLMVDPAGLEIIIWLGALFCTAHADRTPCQHWAL